MHRSRRRPIYRVEPAYLSKPRQGQATQIPLNERDCNYAVRQCDRIPQRLTVCEKGCWWVKKLKTMDTANSGTQGEVLVVDPG
jgi:hypothetical protein